MIRCPRCWKTQLCHWLQQLVFVTFTHQTSWQNSCHVIYGKCYCWVAYFYVVLGLWTKVISTYTLALVALVVYCFFFSPPPIINARSLIEQVLPLVDGHLLCTVKASLDLWSERTLITQDATFSSCIVKTTGGMNWGQIAWFKICSFKPPIWI